ncbi:MAG TPA: hypothetical protein ENF33_05000 [Nitrososphaeria archaeon]|nr:hypothetical protein [Nitrososphaeria archaeon]
MGRRRRRRIRKKVIKPPPKVFTCPICNEEAVAVYHENGSDYAEVICSNCKARARVKWLPSYMAVDAYAEFYDIVTGSKKSVEPPLTETTEATKIDEQGDNSFGQEPSRNFNILRNFKEYLTDDAENP